MMPTERPALSLILPAFDEAEGVGAVVRRLVERFPEAEVLVVDDGSSDATGETAREAGARVVRHPYNMGNGAAVRTGARHARGRILVFMDADGQHAAEEIPRLLARLEEGYELVIGARSTASQASLFRGLGNRFLNGFASWLTGQPIADLTSGFRAARAATFRRFLYLLPNGFSYPTTTTLAFLRSGYPVAFIPIEARKRVGNRSKIKLLRDGTAFFVIILKVVTLFSPMRVFLPASAILFFLGLSRYLWVYMESGRLPNVTVILFLSSLLTFLIGLVSEQITALYFASAVLREETKEED